MRELAGDVVLVWDKRRHTQRVDYWGIPFRCLCCYKTGHLQRECPDRFSKMRRRRIYNLTKGAGHSLSPSTLLSSPNKLSSSPCRSRDNISREYTTASKDPPFRSNERPFSFVVDAHVTNTPPPPISSHLDDIPARCQSASCRIRPRFDNGLSSPKDQPTQRRLANDQPDKNTHLRSIKEPPINIDQSNDSPINVSP